MNKKIYDIADKMVTALYKNGFTIQRYNACKTSSVYLKLDYGVCNSIRISDHKGKSHLHYRYILLVDDTTDETVINELINRILSDRQSKIAQYGINNYKRFMQQNKAEHMHDKNGFWNHSKLVK